MLKRSLGVVIFLVVCGSHAASAQEHSAVDVSGCALARNPKTYDRELIRVRGTLNVEFEDFTLNLGSCNTDQSIWLAFGGDVPGIVASTINDNDRRPGADIKVDGVPLGIKKDDNFRKLYALITSRRGTKPRYGVTATLSGMFFAGQLTKFANGRRGFIGYGHLGCCSLLVITQVSNVESVPPANLEVSGVVMGPDKKPIAGTTIIDDTVGGSPPVRQTAVTDRRGEFLFSNSGQQLRIEDPQYRPMAITIEPGGAPVRIRLQDAKDSDWMIGACSQSSSGRTVGFSVQFTLPKSMAASRLDKDDKDFLVVYPRGNDADRANIFISRRPHLAIDSALSIGARSNDERWIKDASGKIIGIDARGRSTYHDVYFRSLSFSTGDVAGYSGVRAGTQLNIANQILDSACMGTDAAAR